MVIAVGKTTAAPHVRAALDRSGMAHVPLRIVAFPGRPAHKADFHDAMRPVLTEAREAGLLH
jgi:hypothetical protein